MLEPGKRLARSPDFGGQNLQVFPKEGLIVTFTGWDILPSSTGTEPLPSDFLAAVKTSACPATIH